MPFDKNPGRHPGPAGRDQGRAARRDGHRGDHALADADARPAGRIVEVLGDIDEPGVDLEIIIRKHGIPDAHGEAASPRRRASAAVVKPKDIEGRTDFRDVRP